jgi:hypothetical protein
MVEKEKNGQVVDYDAIFIDHFGLKKKRIQWPLDLA